MQAQYTRSSGTAPDYLFLLQVGAVIRTKGASLGLLVHLQGPLGTGLLGRVERTAACLIIWLQLHLLAALDD